MAHFSLNAALAEATAEACRSLIAVGINFAVAVEKANGEWVLLHAESVAHANTLAHAWVDHHNACGASVWRLHDDGPAKRHCGLIQPDWDYA